MPFKFSGGHDSAAYRWAGYKRDGRRYYIVTEAFGYECWVRGAFCRVAVPEGFRTDLASIPSLPFMPKPGGSLWDDAAIVHDAAVCAKVLGRKLFSRAQADAIFCHALRERGCSCFTATIFWLAVRIGGLFEAREDRT
jgi:hypothetical protein